MSRSVYITFSRGSQSPGVLWQDISLLSAHESQQTHLDGADVGQTDIDQAYGFCTKPQNNVASR